VDDFLKSGRPDGPSCLVLDVRLPGQSGLDLQRQLAAADIYLPLIFVTGHGDIPMSVQAMKGGAIEFLTKPFRDQDLLDAVQLGLERDGAWLEHERELAALLYTIPGLNALTGAVSSPRPAWIWKTLARPSACSGADQAVAGTFRNVANRAAPLGRPTRPDLGRPGSDSGFSAAVGQAGAYAAQQIAFAK
jgi:CheY-like chemotaxis protein